MSEWSALLEKATPYTPIGRVEKVIGLIIESRGPQARLGDRCDISTNNPHQPVLPCEVVGFRDGRVLLMPYGELDCLSPGCRVVNTGAPFQAALGPHLLGRILDGLGRPLDDRFALPEHTLAPVSGVPPHPLRRKEIDERLALGVKAIDGFATIGRGQRIGIFSGSGVGKSTTLGMIARNSEADLSVIALIGERGREVRDFIDNCLGPAGLKRSVVIVATSEQPALLKIKAALVATAIAEYFRETGKNVLLMMDSLTRVAMALREVGLAVGEPPTSRGYTPSVFAFMPRLLERAGCSENGSITGLYTVLVEGDDFNEPVSDTVRGLLDGHILLTRDLAEQNHFPAVDVLGSVSRLMVQVADKEHQAAAGRIKDLLATYRKAEDLINIGAYVRGASAKIDRAVALKDDIDQLLRQGIHEQVSFEQTLAQLQAIASRIAG